MSFDSPSFESVPEKSPAEQSQENMRKIIDGLAEKSRYQRQEVSPSQEKIVSPEGEKFSVERIKDPKSKDVQKLFKFLKRFDPEECDSPKIIKDAIANPTDAYAYYIIKNEKGEVIAHTQGSYLEMEPSGEKEESDQAILFMGYTITDEDYGRRGLAMESNRGVFKYAAEKAEQNEQELKAIVVEAVEASEVLANRLGMERIYFEDNEGNIHEVPYICPPLLWDEKTGRPLDPETEEIGEKDIKDYSVPEHLMIRMIDGRKEMDAEELMAILDPVYSDNYTLYRDEGDTNVTDEALEYSKNAVEKFKEELKAALTGAKDGKIFMMDAKERKTRKEELEANGKVFDELVKEEKDEELL